MWPLLREKLAEVLQAVTPLVALVCLLQFTLVQAPVGLFVQFLAGSVLAIAGLVLLFVGIEHGILPMGRFVGAELPKRGSLALIVAVAFALGFAVTVAEPDVLVLASEADAITGGRLSWHAILYLIALGLAAFTALAMVRVVTGWSMRLMLAGAYALALILAALAPAQIVPLAFDAGSVTTGVISAPVVIALTVGLSSVLAGRSAVSDGFGVLGFASVGAIIAMLLMSLVVS